MLGLTQGSGSVAQVGWRTSGDNGYRDPDGYYFLVDRVKDMINVAGFKVFPREVEEVLFRHEAVREAAGVGVPHPGPPPPPPAAEIGRAHLRNPDTAHPPHPAFSC